MKAIQDLVREYVLKFQEHPSPFIGDTWLDTYPNVLFVGSAIGWPDAVNAILLAGASDFTALAAFNCHSTFSESPSVLRGMANRRVLIVPGLGELEEAAAMRWAGELEAVKCHVEFVELPEGICDLGDLLRRPNARHFLNDLFTPTQTTKP